MKNNSELPYNIKRDIYRNGRAMQAFYGLPTDERELVLDMISETNEAVRENAETSGDGRK